MKHFFRGGRGLPMGQSDTLSQISRHYDRNVMERSNPTGLIGDNLFERLLLSLERYRSDARSMERSVGKEGQYRESLRTTFGMASSLLWSYITGSSRIQHRFNTCASGILDQNVIKRCSEGDKTPKLVRSSAEHGIVEARIKHPSSKDKVLYKGISGRILLPFFSLSSSFHRVGIESASNSKRIFPMNIRYQLNHQGINRRKRTEDNVSKNSRRPAKEQRIGKEQVAASLRKSSRGVFSFNTLLIHCYYFEHTWVILRQCTEKASSVVAGSFGRVSGQSRTYVQSCSTAVRQLFGSCSAVRRRAVEALSKTTRRSLEAVPNQSRRRVEELSKTSRSGGCSN